MFMTFIELYEEFPNPESKDTMRGILIGSPVSKDLCNYFLSYAYHYASEKLVKISTRRGKTREKRLISHVIFYADDIVLFSGNATLPDGTADVWIRKNETQLPESEEGPQGVEADEIYFKVTVSTVTKEEISADIDFWFDQLKEKEEGLNADYLSIETYRANKKKEISQICQSTVFAGVDISISSGTEHFSLKDEDQLNLFGKQAQLTAGIKKLEYHEDGNPCRYYSAEDMQKIINGAMEFKSYHTTYANSLNMWIKGCSKASEIAKIEYGAPIPEEYQSEVLKDYLAEMAADKEVK